MVMIRFYFSILLLISVIFGPLSSWANKPKETYAMVVFLKGSDFFNWAYSGVQDAAKNLGDHIQVELHGPETWDAILEAHTIFQLIERRVDGIIVTAGNARALVPAINKAIEAGIPVITFDSDAPDSKRLAFVGTDNYRAGYTAGILMAQWVGIDGALGVSSYPGPSHLMERLQGFKQGVASIHPTIPIFEINDEGKIRSAQPRIAALLNAHPEVNGIFAAHGNPTEGAVKAAQAVASRQVHVLGFDFSQEVIQLIESNQLRATVGQDPYLMGYMSLLLAHTAKHTAPDTPPFRKLPSHIDTGTQILDKSNIAPFKMGPPCCQTSN